MWLPFIAGFVNKLYDDLIDNKCLNPYKNKVVMELLKGLHYISFTGISLQNPLFFILFYGCNALSYFAVKDVWENSYEQSLFFSFFILFFLIDYKKIKKLNIVDYIVIGVSVLICFIEPIVIKGEISLQKLILRLVTVFSSIFMFCFFPLSDTMKIVMIYTIGYFSLSVIVQYLSLFVLNDGTTLTAKKCETKKYIKNKQAKKQAKKLAKKLAKKQAIETSSRNLSRK
jgi:hypothetical protein